MQPAVAIITLGCAKNSVDSEKMEARLTEAGYRVVGDPSSADAVIVNTCAFIQAATEESLETIFDLADQDEGLPDKRKIIVAGCLPSRYGAELEGELYEAAAFVSCSKEDDIATVVAAALGETSGGGCDEQPCNDAVEENDRSLRTGVADESESFSDQEERFFGISRYVKISDGCNRFCSFCAIPFIRGRYRSFPYEDIRADAEAAIAQGAREIVLIAQDTGIWGSDLPDGHTLAWLLSALAETFPDTWFRVMYIQPDGITDELLDAMAQHANICSYLDIPIQHCNGGILKAMNRSGDEASLEALVAKIRAAVPGVALRTTVMVGYPGEGEAEFEELLAFLERVEFDYVGLFAFSPEDGTRAAKLAGQVDEQVKLERLQAVRDLCDALSTARIAQRVGQTVEVVIEGIDEDGHPFGRTMGQGPEVDGYTFVEGCAPGEVVSAIIEDSLFYDMEGTRA